MAPVMDAATWIVLISCQRLSPPWASTAVFKRSFIQLSDSLAWLSRSLLQLFVEGMHEPGFIGPSLTSQNFCPWHQDFFRAAREGRHRPADELVEGHRARLSVLFKSSVRT